MDLQQQMAQIGQMGIGFAVLFVIVGILVSAAVLLLSMKVTKVTGRSYLKALGVVVVAGIVAFIVQWILMMIIPGMIASLLGLIASLLITAGFITLFCKAPYPRAIGTAALYWVFMIILGILVGVISMLV